MSKTTHDTLHKHLGLRDVFAISAGAMFSSGFFLLPGLASADAGSAVVLAYVLAGILIIPAALTIAELATAMPRAGGAYYFLDRAMGPLMGTIGGLGSWLSLVLKSAFALVGMGAYLVMLFDLPIEPVSVALTVAFAAINIRGVKEGAKLQRWLVAVLIGVLVFFIAEGLWAMAAGQLGTAPATRLGTDALFDTSTGTLFATAGMVFVSYAGLTKVASVAEEIDHPQRNIPLGMLLALGVTTLIYGFGVAVVVAAINPSALATDVTPIATAGATVMTVFPPGVVTALIAAAAVAAFASTANAGLLSASRYPLAMARDHLMPKTFAKLSAKRRTPTLSILLTSALMIVVILTLDATSLAKLASAVQLLLFALLCIALVIMRESHIEGYQPGFSSPLYPWVQLAGAGIYVALIMQMGWFVALSTSAVFMLFGFWHLAYGRQRVRRRGAVYHCFERLGRRVHRDLDHELDGILAERKRDNQTRRQRKLEKLNSKKKHALATDEHCQETPTSSAIGQTAQKRLRDNKPLSRGSY